MIIKIQLSAIARDINSEAQPLGIALRMLIRAYQYAVDTKVDRWEYAISISEFRYAGVMISELRWLLYSGSAIHARETVYANGQYRKYTRLDIRSIPPDASFILSDQGVKALEASVQTAVAPKTMLVGSPSNGTRRNAPILEIAANLGSVPEWDARKRELKFQGEIVRAFRSTAPNQERILAAFQEEGWARRIDDPLPPQSNQDPQERLRSAIKQLNRSQDNKLLRFCGDGSGRGILWQGLA